MKKIGELTMKKSIGFMLVFMVVSMMGFASLVSAATVSQIGFVDLQRVVAESVLGKKGNKELKSLKNTKMKAVEKLKHAAEVAAAKVEKAQAKGLETGKLSVLIMEARKKGTALKRLIEDVNEELANRNNMLNVTVMGKANNAMLKIAKEKGLMVIYKNTDNLAYLSPVVDITDAVIKEVNKMK